MILSILASIGLGQKTYAFLPQSESEFLIADHITFQESPTPAPASVNSGRIYFDNVSDRFMVSENGGPFTNLVASDFSNNGDNAGANRTLGNLDNFDLGFITSGLSRMQISATGQVSVNNLPAGSSASFNVDNGSVLFAGTNGAVPVTGAGTRMMWIPSLAAFRAGLVSANQWDTIGINSIAMGTNSSATATSSVAIGDNTAASQTRAYAYGSGLTASGTSSTAIGQISTATNFFSAVFGNLSNSTGQLSVAVGGLFANATNTLAHAFGNSVDANALNSMVIGSGQLGSSTNVLRNSIPNSIMIGMGSDTPTMFISGALGLGQTGNVGFGTTTPARLVHINDAMRIEPQASPPSGASLGDLYVDTSGSLCFFDGGSWQVAAGGGTCA